MQIDSKTKNFNISNCYKVTQHDLIQPHIFIKKSSQYYTNAEKQDNAGAVCKSGGMVNSFGGGGVGKISLGKNIGRGVI